MTMKMSEEARQILQHLNFNRVGVINEDHDNDGVIMEDDGGDEFCESLRSIVDGDDDEEESSIEKDSSTNSESSSDLMEDASSLTSPSSTWSPSAGPLYELSELMAQLPKKRGLSKYYQGKSQSFTSLTNVKSIEDLAKQGSTPHRIKMMKSCKSFGGLDGHKLFSPKAVISKKASRGSFFVSNSLGKRSAFLGESRLSITPL